MAVDNLPHYETEITSVHKTDTDHKNTPDSIKNNSGNEMRWHYQWRKFGLTQSQKVIFVSSQWQKSSDIPVSYVCYRWILGLVFIAIVVAAMVIHAFDNPVSPFGSWFIFFTHWGLLLQTTHFVLAAWITTAAWRTQRQLNMVGDMETSRTSEKDDSLSTLYKISWLLGNIMGSLALCITLGYWTLIYNPRLYTLRPMTFISHGVNAVAMLLDFLISSRPCYIQHVIHPFLVYNVYCIFSIIYWLLGGTHPKGRPFIYEALNWTRVGGTMIYITGGAIMIILIHCVLYLLWNLRVHIAKKFSRGPIYGSMSYDLGTVSTHNGHYVWKVQDPKVY